MITFANAKINLGLQILKKRVDGYHELSTVMVPIPFQDVIEILPADETKLTVLGTEIPGDMSDNLMMKAYRLLQTSYELPPVHMILKKNIAMGAGLGGGSADATAVLKGLNDMFELNLSNDELKNKAAQLGMDCPFFVLNTAQIGSERGEVLQPIDLDLKGMHLRLVCPGIHVSTADAYGGVTPFYREFPLEVLLSKDWEKCRELLVNDFESSVFKNHPAIEKIKMALYEQGALYASMSGSGSSVFGLFDHCPPTEKDTEGVYDFVL